VAKKEVRYLPAEIMPLGRWRAEIVAGHVAAIKRARLAAAAVEVITW